MIEKRKTEIPNYSDIETLFSDCQISLKIYDMLNGFGFTWQLMQL